MTSMANDARTTFDRSETVRSTGRSTPLVLILGTVLAPLFTLLLTGCALPPPHNDRAFLSYTTFDWGCEKLSNCPKLTDDAAASAYYQSIGAEDANGNPNFNLEGWKQLYGYYESEPVHAVYGNKLDLRLGRNMNCWQPQGTSRVACFVTNYHFDNDLARDVGFAADGGILAAIGTVAMLYDPNGIGIYGDTVTFYAFGAVDENGDQHLIRSLRLDSEGFKTVPGMCMACHSGGDIQTGLHRNNFLPFDVQSFQFISVLDSDGGHPTSQPSPYDLDSQQEAFRKLNALVLKAAASPAIHNLVNGLYGGNVNTPGATVPDDTYIPAGWDVDKTSRNIYRHVYRKYCRTCHVAQVVNKDGEPLALESFSDFQTQEDAVLRTMCGFNTMAMPNAQVPYGVQLSQNLSVISVGFWEDAVAKDDLKQYFESKGRGTCF